MPSSVLVSSYFTTKHDSRKSIKECVTWKTFDAVLLSSDGQERFRQNGVEAPDFWSQRAVNITAEKYFRVINGVKEHSVWQMVHRIASTIADAGIQQNTLSTTERDTFYEELCFILLTQKFAFNSPVQFNIGVLGAVQQASACFIQSVSDDMESITDLQKKEVLLFKGGSGTGSNLSALRSSREGLANGGTASGPVSFMQGLDSWAGITKSGGGTRRAAKLVCLNMGHPDILTQANGRPGFIRCKSAAEKVAHDLYDTGKYSAEFNAPGNVYELVPYQNANHSVRVTDGFMLAVENDQEWATRYIKSGVSCETYRARDLWNEIAKAAHYCGDPGVQFDTTINSWHTCPNSAPINASNPCCFVGETPVDVVGPRRLFSELEAMCQRGEELPPVRSFDRNTRKHCIQKINKVWVAGYTSALTEVRTARGLVLRSTPEHPYLTLSGGDIEAQLLSPGALLQTGAGEQSDMVVSVQPITLDTPVPVYDMEVEGTHYFGVLHKTSSSSVIAHNSEYMFLDDSACNLGSHNLMRYLDAEGLFDVDGFSAANRVCITAMEILVGYSDYPSPKIKQNSLDFRPLGIGAANYGALLMHQGYAYDSDLGRHLAASITALMSGVCYEQSARIAQRVGAFTGFAVNRDPMLAVVKRHQVAASASMDPISTAARGAWQQALALGQHYGFRNSQISVLAPTGTIAFMMDCDTTGIECMTALVQYKKLVGGGTLKMPNAAALAALKRLRYSDEEITAITKVVEDTGELLDAVKPAHKKVFQTAIGKDPVSIKGHLKMMAAVQPFLSGAISKTVNMPSDATVDDVAEAYLQAWKLGLKSVALYVDGCKLSQPVAAALTDTSKGAVPFAGHVWGQRKRLPKTRQAMTHKFTVGGQEGYITVGLYPDGSPAEVFLEIANVGSTMHGVLDMAAKAISLGLQHGMPLHTLVAKYRDMQFEPRGFTDDDEIRTANSIADYLAKFLILRFPIEKSATVTTPVVSSDYNGPPCGSCGTLTRRSGSCWCCSNCGSTTGCG